MMNSRKIAIRVDASEVMGTGHFMRCLTLADSLEAYYSDITFICRHIPEHFKALISTRGYHFYKLDGSSKEGRIQEQSSYGDWLGVDQVVDAKETINILSEKAFDTLVVDHYALDYRWETTVRSIANKIMVIDDLANRRHECDILLDQNYYKNLITRYSTLVPAECRLLLGPQFALLREDFHELRNGIEVRKGPVKRVLVFLGGMDSGNYTSFVIRALLQLELNDVDVDVVIGDGHPQKENIKSICSRYQIECHVQTTRMGDLIAAADLGIGAGGSVNLERCFLGLPTIVISVAENQEKACSDLHEIGALIYLGKAELVKERVLAKKIMDVMNNSLLRQKVSTTSVELTSSLSKKRIIQELVYDHV